MTFENNPYPHGLLKQVGPQGFSDFLAKLKF